MAAGLAGLAGLLSTTAALAYCRTTTCDPKDPTQQCVKDPRTKCIHEGLPLFWPEKCISFGVQQDGSPLRGIPYKLGESVVQEAFRTWMNVDCGNGQRPSFRMWDVGAAYGGLVCDAAQFNDSEPNANIWMFRDDGWPYVGASSTLALTTITFDVPTGQILDADVEINSFTVPLSTSTERVENDLLSIATHEAGHFLGLAHSHLPSSTMFENYEPGDLSFRTLERDDIAGICNAYPPDREALECNGPRPRHGFSRYCSEPFTRDACTLASDAPGTTGTAALGLAVTALAFAGRRRRRRAASA